MPLHHLSRIVINSLKAILGEDYTILSFEKLPSRRNEVYKIIGFLSFQPTPSPLIVKYYKQVGIAHETYILREAYHHRLHVPTIIGTTGNVLVLEFIDAPNLCDLITFNPDEIFGKMLASWLAQYHTVFSRRANQVLLKGDARIRNYLVLQDHLVGIDFEESHIGSYHEDLAVVCASILDTTPLFTKPKLKLCEVMLDYYGALRQIRNLYHFKATIQNHMVQVLQDTVIRRGKPSKLSSYVRRFAREGFSF